uniref:Uncharacterized protein n=1 Tax=Anguilla anguilla TaxID=7936 RepID=A0A0E9UPQ2_ANGAN
MTVLWQNLTCKEMNSVQFPHDIYSYFTK